MNFLFKLFIYQINSELSNVVVVVVILNYLFISLTESYLMLLFFFYTLIFLVFSLLLIFIDVDFLQPTQIISLSPFNVSRVGP
jgi:hypothetical protein